MQPEWEAALQKQRERVLFAAGQWAAWIQAGAVGDDPPLRSALDNYGRLARAIGAAEACDAERRDPVWCTHNEDVSAIIRELGVE